MKRNRSITICLIFAAALGFAFLGFGARHLQAQQAQAEDTAVAVVNVPILISQCDAFVAFQADLNQRSQALNAQLQQRQGDINVMIADLQLIDPGNVAERRAKEREIVESRVQLQAWFQIEQTQLRAEQRQFLIELYGVIDATVSRIAQRQGYDLVLFDTPTPDFSELEAEELLRIIGERRVVYRDADIDLTPIVLAELNLNRDLQNN